MIGLSGQSLLPPVNSLPLLIMSPTSFRNSCSLLVGAFVATWVFQIDEKVLEDSSSVTTGQPCPSAEVRVWYPTATSISGRQVALLRQVDTGLLDDFGQVAEAFRLSENHGETVLTPADRDLVSRLLESAAPSKATDHLAGDLH